MLKIENCLDFYLFFHSTPDVTEREQPRICVWIIDTMEVLRNIFRLVKEQARQQHHRGNSQCIGQTRRTNMTGLPTGCYRGLQKINKKKNGSHVVYFHCYAHWVNLGMKDSINLELTNVIKMFDDLGSLHNLFNPSGKIHQLFGEFKKGRISEICLSNITIWSIEARESCFGVFHEQYDKIIELTLVFFDFLFRRKFLQCYVSSRNLSITGIRVLSPILPFLECIISRNQEKTFSKSKSGTLVRNGHLSLFKAH